MPDIGTEGRRLFIVSKFDQLGGFLLVRRERVYRQLAKASAKLDQIFGRDILVSEDDQLVLDQRILDRFELLV